MLGDVIVKEVNIEEKVKVREYLELVNEKSENVKTINVDSLAFSKETIDLGCYKVTCKYVPPLSSSGLIYCKGKFTINSEESVFIEYGDDDKFYMIQLAILDDEKGLIFID